MENDLRVGGAFTYKMAAKDGSLYKGNVIGFFASKTFVTILTFECENCKLHRHLRGLFDNFHLNYTSFINKYFKGTPFSAAIDSERLRSALKSERRSSQDEAGNVAFNFDIKPYYYQQEILDKLKAEREVHQSFKNLAVAATGTGKTVIAAFDYQDFCRANPGKPNKLLFVAHRKEILSQSLACFRGILKDLNFGSKMSGQ